MKKTAVIGASGYIGSHLWKSYRDHFPDCVGTAFSKSSEVLHHFDIRNPDLKSLRLLETGHECVIIASAKPSVEYCEQYKNLAYEVNVKGVLDLVKQIDEAGLPVIFLSTDYVFQGTSAPYRDTDLPQPTTEYGRQKFAVETNLPSLISNYLILRLSKIYGTQRGDGTLLNEISHKFLSNSEMRMATDQMFCPTHISDIVEVIHSLQSLSSKGTFNLCSPQGTSRYNIAMLMANEMNADKNLVHPIFLHDIPSMHLRPLDTRMHPSDIVTKIKPQFISVEQSITQIARLFRTSGDKPS